MKKLTILKRGISSILLIFFLVILIQEFNLKSLNSINETRLIITPEYTNYLKGEPVWINVKITNQSNRSLFLDNHFMVGYGLDFSITNNTSKKLEKSLMTMFYENNSIELLPNETMENNVNLEFYTFANPGYTGEYKIRAKYDSLVSNEISIYVHEPVGFEKEVYEFLNYENNANHTLTSNKIYLDSVKEKLLKLYPTSQYAPALCYELLTNLSHDRDSSKFFEIFDSYMQNNKNKISTINIIAAFAVFIKSYNSNSSNDFISQLEQLKIKYQLDENMRRSINRFIKLNYYNDKNWCKY